MRTAIVIPFRENGKSRLGVGELERHELARAMLLDVVSASLPVGLPIVVTEDRTAVTLVGNLGARTVGDPGGGQGAAVAAALAAVSAWPALVVNADVPCVAPRDLRTLLAATPRAGIAIAPAADRTTNALSLAAAGLFAPLYGPGSAGLFREHARTLGAEVVDAAIPNLADDVDDLDDLRRVGLRAGPRTQAALATLGIAA